MIIVFLGPPGSGKGTLAKKLAGARGYLHIAAGDLLRDEVAKKSPLGGEINHYISQGLLVPDKIIVQLIENNIVAASRQATSPAGIILDGFPRSMEQAMALEKMLDELGDKHEKESPRLNTQKIDAVIYFNVSQEESVQRLSGRLNCPKCGAVYHLKNLPPKIAGRCDLDGAELIVRSDDQPETIKKRYVVYESQTKPLIEYYRKKGVLHLLDAAAGVEQVLDSLLTIVRLLKK